MNGPVDEAYIRHSSPGIFLLGLSDHEIARLHGPVGLHIGSHTPPEIALSLMAEIVSIKNGVQCLQKKPHLLSVVCSA
ncbi:xanthine/CO dehydrogenase XdhC/CoxF family maturation factor [Pseudomonas baetica]|nr:xanthine/CO dehydrogenase XdhC/CoxF family maturation factor [Pseudomonas baetica]